MTSINYNPDVLLCLANLSNDEVFTPPELANSILDLLPKDIWKNKDAKFLDPVSKSGVFLREITKRLIVGLEDEIPDLQTRVNHILKNQVFGIAITELTSLLSKRTLYCAKSANSDKSICNEFKNEDGNIRYKNINHTFKSGKCEFCGANEDVYSRDDDMETHAYEFIHTNNPKEIFNMKFDVIVGNPPYQLNVGVESKSFAISIYDKFVQQAKKLNPRYLTMIIPARWYAGGRGLDNFRDEMLKDKRIRTLIDFPDSNDCFPQVEIKGGVCYFLWDREYIGECEVISYSKGKISSKATRSLLEEDMNTFIRFTEAISIFKKVKKYKEKPFSEIVSVQTPFGLISSFRDFKTNYFENSIKIYAQNSIGYVNKDYITKGVELIDKYKIYISKSYGANESYPHQIINKPFIGDKNSCCTQTYLLIGIFDTEMEALNAISYMKTRFFRFLVMLKKISQDAMRGVYQLVPMQNFNETWTDEKLYKKYGLSQEEIDFIESMIRPMDSSDE